MNHEYTQGIPLEAAIANKIELTVEEYTRLKDIETRFAIIKEQMLHAEYCPIHTQIILGIEQERKEKKEFNLDSIFNDDGK